MPGLFSKIWPSKVRASEHPFFPPSLLFPLLLLGELRLLSPGNSSGRSLSRLSSVRFQDASDPVNATRPRKAGFWLFCFPEGYRKSEEWTVFSLVQSVRPGPSDGTGLPIPRLLIARTGLNTIYTVRPTSGLGPTAVDCQDAAKNGDISRTSEI